MTPLLYNPFPHPFWVRMFLFAQNGKQIWTGINKKDGFKIKLLWFMESMDRNMLGTKYGWRHSNFRPLLSLLSIPLCIMPSFFCLFVERLLFTLQGEKVWLPTASEYYIFRLLSLVRDWLLFIGVCLKIPRDQNWWAPLGSHVLHFGNKLRTVSRGSFYKPGSSHGHSFWESSAIGHPIDVHCLSPNLLQPTLMFHSCFSHFLFTGWSQIHCVVQNWLRNQAKMSVTKRELDKAGCHGWKNCSFSVWWVNDSNHLFIHSTNTAESYSLPSTRLDICKEQSILYCWKELIF